jgi:hypothetical protein
MATTATDRDPPRQPARREPSSGLEAFRAGFKRSTKGNLWGRWQEVTLTIFPQRHGYAWCIADEDGPAYSLGVYQTEAEAVAALWRELND